jgi:DNA-binding MarR family transcriptional regulator
MNDPRQACLLVRTRSSPSADQQPPCPPPLTDRSRTLRLTPSQFDVIVTLGDTTGLTCSQLSSQTLVTKGTLTGVLDRLAKKGLIRRESVAGDKRRTKIRLTEKGYALFQRVFAAHIAFIRPFFERALSPQEIETIRSLLLRIRDSFQEGG